MKMSEQVELEKLQAMRAELEAESRSLIEEQEKLGKNVLALEEQVVVEELKKEKAVIEDLKNRNQTAKDAIAQLEAKKKELETRLKAFRTPETSTPEEKKPEAPPTQPEETEEALEAAQVSGESEEGEVIITAVGDAVFEVQEIVDESPKQEKKKRRFF